ncbi:FecR domain-containing protein [Dyadobacter sp. CY345]|uniref:FecR family protein n=1 Tax=Dyadobacter sp. CY345 TaxID=2909335 RepID=UPI001F23B395|nr:FecR family protein [Dyadobacter sp. CY345]MCF2444922.1 FecR domain-containing protein [Dyadobacter sp. CY345]
MQDYRNLQPEELAVDHSFRLWKLSKDPDAGNFWINWLSQNPDKQDLIDKASHLLDKVFETFDEISDEEVTNEIDRLSAVLEKTEEKYSSRRLIFRPEWYRAAASIIMILGLGWWMSNKYSASKQNNLLYNQIISQIKEPLLKATNDTDRPKLVSLEDGSTVLLQPKSSISYPQTFKGEKREVFLSGEAFFEVAKNPDQPFYVYANNLVTKVLGTSFIISAFENDKDVKVAVKTGKVSVFALTDENLETQQADNKLGAMVLTPNQQIVFSTGNLRLTRSLIADPELQDLPIQKQSFDFKATPIKDVFEALEKSYGVKILFDAETMKDCYLTASLSDEPLFEKVDLICRTINARYEQLDASIIIYSKGCTYQNEKSE